MRRRYVGGFTFIELMVSALILAILASVALPLSEMAYRRNKERALKEALHEIRGAIDAYKRASDEGRVAHAADASGYPPRLQALVEGVRDAKDPRGASIYFLRRLPRDPFADAAAVDGGWALRSYASSADDPRPGADVYDVYSRSDGVGADGRAYRSW